ncbi:MAG TPA: 2Fe-2S iron-sulfur cluster-binding protein [Terracidiphilus sp.]|nr:2Fe-2S iron-sulfur cluster-binding protein [Terracidiphilus sp.]
MRACPNQPTIELSINGRCVVVPACVTVAVALLMSGDACRVSVSGEKRGPLCGMGICMECCATVNGTHHVRTCQLEARAGMEIVIE